MLRSGQQQQPLFPSNTRVYHVFAFFHAPPAVGQAAVVQARRHPKERQGHASARPMRQVLPTVECFVTGVKDCAQKYVHGALAGASIVSSVALTAIVRKPLFFPCILS